MVVGKYCPSMLIADLRGKLHESERDLEWREDLLTAAVFGSLRYLPRELFAAILLRAASKNPGTRLGAVDLSAFATSAEIALWPNHSIRMGDTLRTVVPDVTLVTSAFAVVVECKLGSRLGEDNTQLAREVSLSAAEGQNGCVLVVTSPRHRHLFAKSCWDCVAMLQGIALEIADLSRLAWISWSDVAHALEDFAQDSLLPCQQEHLRDIIAVLHRRDFRGFRGIRPPCWREFHTAP